jgi:hypothetical protein
MAKGSQAKGRPSDAPPAVETTGAAVPASESAAAVRKKKKKRRKRVRATNSGDGIEVVCRDCNAVVRAEDIDLPSRLAKCASCHRVFSFTVGGDDGMESSSLAQYESARVPRPAKFRVAEEPATSDAEGYRDSLRAGAQRLRIEWRWFSHVAWALLAFCLFWDGFLALWYLKVLTSQPSLLAGVGPLLHVAAGIGLTYYTLALFVNRTTVVVDGETLRVQHAPLPWLGPGVMPVRDIDQLYCRRDAGKNVRYSVHVIRKSGKTQKLIGGLGDPGEALFLEYEIERVLELVDYAVVGEFRG